jgi:hypothetical protein
VWRREGGGLWTIAFEGRVIHVADAVGVRHLGRLLAQPGADIHALDLSLLASAREGGPRSRSLAAEGLAGECRAAGEAGPMLDQEAKAAYRSRLMELRDDVVEADRFNDGERAARARAEIDWLTRELARAVGLGGRDRPAASDAERARVRVTLGIRTALERISAAHPALGRHLAATVRTGVYCSYRQDPRLPIAWKA